MTGNRLLGGLVTVVAVLAVLPAFSGTSTRTSFSLTDNGIADSNLIASGSGVALGVKYTATIKLFGDTLPGTPNRTMYPDVFMKGKDTVDVFFIDTSAKQVKTQRIFLLAGGVASAGPQTKAFDLKNIVRYLYLHVDKGANGYLASYIQDAGGNNYIVTLNNGTASLQTDSSGTKQWISSTQCHLAQDTFLVMSIVGTKKVTIHKVYSRGSTLTKTDSVLVDTGASPTIVNGALAADSAGGILAAYTRGLFVGAKTLDYQFFDRDLTPGPAGVLSPAIGENAFYYYDDVAVVSYGTGKFALASWDQDGVLLHTITRSGNTVTHDTTRIISKTGVKFCTIAASNRFLVVACMGDVDGNGVRCVEGIRYMLVNGTPDSAKSISFSDPSTPVITSDSSYSSAMNAAVDDSGAIALVWRNQYKIAGCVWAHRTIRHARGFYRSPVDSLRYDNDSIRFKPLAAALSSTQYWNTEPFLRVGPTVAACTSAAWFSFSDTSVLSQHRTTDCYYQTKLYIARKSGSVIDSFATPRLTSYTVSWNVKPKFTAIDSVRTPLSFIAPYPSGSTVNVISRRDSVLVHAALHDADNGDAVTVTSLQASTPATQTLGGGPDFRGTFSVHPFVRSDTTYLCTLTVRDNANWYGLPSVVRCRTRNSPPVLMLSYRQAYGLSGGHDSLLLTHDTTCIVQQEDTVTLIFSVADSNDAGTVGAMIRTVDGTDSVYHDTIGAGITARFTIAADTIIPVDTVRMRVLAEDIDTLTALEVSMIVNHPPVIREIAYGDDTLHGGDTAAVVLDDTARFYVIVHDTDCTFGDTLDYLTVTPSRRDSVHSRQTTERLALVPDEGDTVMSVRVTDRFGRTDSCVLHLSYPWFETGSQNPGYAAALQYCSDSISLIDGSPVGDTVIIPILNTGRDPLTISAVILSDVRSRWYSLTFISGGDTVAIVPEDGGSTAPMVIEPRNSMQILVYGTARELSGDSLFHDTVTLVTNDPRHRRVALPLRLEYNDLPRIISITSYFVTDAPYRSFAKIKQYVFPPHAKIALLFSEPMDTVSTPGAITIYSIRDRNFTGIMQPLPLECAWLQNNTVLHISPVYAATSPYFKLKPPAGLFIPTDSIAIRITDSLRDVATTPSGPNYLDINLDYRRQRGADTTVTRQVDSIMFTVATVTPDPGDRGFARDGSIRLLFSSPFYAASVDTSRENNRSFTVVSTYNGGRSLAFSAIDIDSTSVTFRLRQELFYRDTLDCYYHSRWVRDSLGYATDNNRDGIDISIFDTLSHDDDLQWGYRVRTITVASTEPESASVLTEVSPKVVIHFDGAIPAGAIDTDTSKSNRSFRIGSGRTGYSSLRSIAYLPDSTGIIVQPRLTFFSNDSVYCSFTGFTDRYRYDTSENVPVDSTDTFGGHSWFFRSGEIGFYTYPNPYKPGSDPRHCGEDGPCGIWFKNLHTLGKDISEVSIAIYSMNAHPVFDTRKQGVRITFDDRGTDNLPQWKWDTRNARGDAVASGLYLYAVFDADDAVLTRGKLVIVR